MPISGGPVQLFRISADICTRDRIGYRPLPFRISFNDIHDILHRTVASFDVGSGKMALRAVA